ncbi:ATP-binding protein [Paenibacillus taichungensis]|uniref:ATP-binding protein n=1 Tax=Paenibacillus taichungensis TaxID=484184 RepID=UPI002DB94C4E|nr:ATP-binding protein [Paenibacillus taichungensis]MEC0109096.1 ATP-binding protein [Paenibacillus taichungensis]MEC0197269.1 ATP-binding protein [Paenibacillus taichungensis]
MDRLVVMTVGKTHSGKTTFAQELESVLQQAIVIDQDNHAEFINEHYKKLRPIEGPNTLKFSVTDAIVNYATEQSNFHIILSNSNLNKSGRAKVLRYFHNKEFKSIIVYFDLPDDLLKDRVIRTQRSKAIFRSASSFLEVLERQENLLEIQPSKDEANYIFIIKDQNNIAEVIQQIIAITGTR